MTDYTNDVNGKKYYYQYSHRGDAVSLTDKDGNIINSYEYDAFGKVVNKTENIFNRYGFSTKPLDETNLNFFGHRFYSAELGRWTRHEPLGELENPNLYNFVQNDPLNNIDVLGLALVGLGDRSIDSLYRLNYDQLRVPYDNEPSSSSNDFSFNAGVEKIKDRVLSQLISPSGKVSGSVSILIGGFPGGTIWLTGAANGSLKSGCDSKGNFKVLDVEVSLTISGTIGFGKSKQTTQKIKKKGGGNQRVGRNYQGRFIKPKTKTGNIKIISGNAKRPAQSLTYQAEGKAEIKVGAGFGVQTIPLVSIDKKGFHWNAFNSKKYSFDFGLSGFFVSLDGTATIKVTKLF